MLRSAVRKVTLTRAQGPAQVVDVLSPSEHDVLGGRCLL